MICCIQNKLINNKDAASVTGCLLKNFRLASLKSCLKYFKYLEAQLKEFLYNFVQKAISITPLRKFLKKIHHLKLCNRQSRANTLIIVKLSKSSERNNLK